MQQTRMSSNISQLQEYRCSCGKLLFKAEPLASAVEIKCPRCRAIRLFEATQSKETDRV